MRSTFLSMTLAVFVFAGFALDSSYAQTVISNNFGIGDTFIHNGGQAIGVLNAPTAGVVKTAAMPFTPGANYILERVELAVSLQSGAK